MPNQDSFETDFEASKKAGDERNKAEKAFRDRAAQLLEWIKDNLPPAMDLPDRCKMFTSGEFVQYDTEYNRYLLEVHSGRTQTMIRRELLELQSLLNSGWLQRLARQLAKEAESFNQTSREIETFLAERQQ